MPIRLPAASEELRTLDALSPREIVAELDRHVVGQAAAKRAVAIALRNRMRRQRLPPDVAAEITPKNILMIGPTGVGKTEIARRLARLSGSPFLKVEASKFTEVGYVGRDVDSIVRDLTEAAVDLVRREKQAEVREKAEAQTEERLLDLLLPPPRSGSPPETPEAADAAGRARDSFRATREKLRAQLRAGQLEERVVEIEVQDRSFPTFQILSNQGVEEMDINVKDLLPGLFGGKTRRRALPLGEARDVLRQEEESRLVDAEHVARLAVERVQAAGIVFLDEIDKIAGREGLAGPDVSREGVQRDILPIVEGTTISTKYGAVRTDHILFIAAGAFHVAKPTDLIPELQGRFPIRVELTSLGEEDLVRILTEPKSALVEQYRALLSTEDVDLRFTEEAVREMARFAMEVNEATENIGARRLATILETVLDEVSFEGGGRGARTVVIDAPEVRRKLEPLVKDQDLSRFIL
ncbi:MAG TPA: ATP-dependent protease ATPase subunit HslU [Vicinamibacteria bacterium]|jgi:ATP-dependent HslUV protease ATP-binding subunit HslU|nr:ATP-dependent protease ATPase subunit HslU [Vicinamibacteria bacterium]